MKKHNFELGDCVVYEGPGVSQFDISKGVRTVLTKGARGRIVYHDTWYEHYRIKVTTCDFSKNTYEAVFDVSWKELRPYVKHQQIQHIVNNRTTIVILPDGRKGIAKCYPYDKFDMYEGLRIALSRAYGKDPFENKNEDEGKFSEWIQQEEANKQNDKDAEFVIKINIAEGSGRIIDAIAEEVKTGKSFDISAHIYEVKQ